MEHKLEKVNLLRAQLAQAKDELNVSELKAKVSLLEAELRESETELYNAMLVENVNTVTQGDIRAALVKQTTYTIVDQDEFFAFVRKEGIPEILQKRIVPSKLNGLGEIPGVEEFTKLVLRIAKDESIDA